MAIIRNTKQQPSFTDNKSCLACGETLLNKKMWNNIPERRGTYGKLSVNCLDESLAKIKGASPEEIRMIKNNLPEPIELDWNPEPVINLLDPEQFHKHYQELAPTREEQEQ
ncbi:hypothetical protein G9A89_015775 [Geosiphon pyriformis]|nr:hypothetical protein G9A89_015775 [Geosiphon pyriformis]